MQVTIVKILVKHEFINEFIEASRKNHAGSIQEPGNHRFDLIQSLEDPCEFIFYEAYSSEQDVLAHKQTEHYLTWRDAVKDMMAAPRLGVKYRGVCPETD